MSSVVQQQQLTPRHFLVHGLFRDVVLRERRHADRFDHSVGLVTVGLRSNGFSTREQVPIDLVRAVAAAVTDRQYSGWLQEGVLLGVLVPESDRSAGEFTRGAETRVREKVRGLVSPETAQRVSIESHMYSPGMRQVSEERTGDPFEIHAAPEAGRRPHAIAKRGLDVAGTVALLVLLSPVFLLIAVLLKLTSRGPVLYKQTRIGQRGKPFTMLKFRSMRVDADPSVHQRYVASFIRSAAELHPAGRKAVYKLTRDPRVTPLGRILRKTSLDELPQFWNVLKGEMSLVGPRPPLAYEVANYRPWHWRRVLEAKPGITGLWQVHGRSRTTFDEMVRMDLHYVRNCSLWGDIKILLATPAAVLSGKGAA